MGKTSSAPKRNNADRRLTPRVGVECWAEERCREGVYFHRVTNISRDGFFVEKKLPFPTGQTINIRLSLPGADNQFDAQTRVVDNYLDSQANLRGAGFQFLNLDAQTRAGIEAFVNQAYARP